MPGLAKKIVAAHVIILGVAIIALSGPCALFAAYALLTSPNDPFAGGILFYGAISLMFLFLGYKICKGGSRLLRNNKLNNKGNTVESQDEVPPPV